MLKFILYLLISYFSFVGGIFPQWLPQTSTTGSRLTGVYFIDENTGWVCGDSVLLRTTNSGVNWIGQSISGRLTSIYFAGSSTGWVSGLSGKIYKTSDAGLSWLLLNSGTARDLMTVYFIDPNTGVASGYFRTILRTTNGGANWSSLLDENYFHFLASYGSGTGNYFYVSGSSGVVFRSSNGGVSWDSLSVGMPNSVNALKFFDINIGWAFGCCGSYFKTTNARLEWTNGGYLTFGRILNTCSFIDQNTGWAAGELGNVVRTTDAGISWDSLTAGVIINFGGIYFVNGTTGWVVGDSGVIFKTTNGGGQGFPIAVKAVSNEVPQKFNLYQNYPNPFNPITKIRFSLPIPSEGRVHEVTLAVYDVLGRELEMIVNGKLTPGAYDVRWSGNNYPSGVYFYKLTVFDDATEANHIFSETGRMVLLK